IVEIRVTGIFPMKLLVSPLQKTLPAEYAPFRFCQKGHMCGGEFTCRRDLHEGVCKRAADGISQRAWCHEQSRARDRREPDRDLKLGIVVAAGALECLGPTMIENVFPAGMAFHVRRCCTQKGTILVFDEKVPRLPARSAADCSRLLQRRQKLVRNEWVGGLC